MYTRLSFPQDTLLDCAQKYMEEIITFRADFNDETFVNEIEALDLILLNSQEEESSAASVKEKITNLKKGISSKTEETDKLKNFKKLLERIIKDLNEILKYEDAIVHKITKIQSLIDADETVQSIMNTMPNSVESSNLIQEILGTNKSIQKILNQLLDNERQYLFETCLFNANDLSENLNKLIRTLVFANEHKQVISANVNNAFVDLLACENDPLKIGLIVDLLSRDEIKTLATIIPQQLVSGSFLNVMINAYYQLRESGGEAVNVEKIFFNLTIDETHQFLQICSQASLNKFSNLKSCLIEPTIAKLEGAKTEIEVKQILAKTPESVIQKVIGYCENDKSLNYIAKQVVRLKSSGLKWDSLDDVIKYNIFPFLDKTSFTNFFESVRFSKKHANLNKLGGLQATFINFLDCVVRGNITEAENLLTLNPKLLLNQTTIEDTAKRKFNNFSAFQYAIWAYDINMLRMFLKHLCVDDANEACKQHLSIHEAGYGDHYIYSREFAAQIARQIVANLFMGHNVNDIYEGIPINYIPKGMSLEEFNANCKTIIEGYETELALLLKQLGSLSEANVTKADKVARKHNENSSVEDLLHKKYQNDADLSQTFSQDYDNLYPAPNAYDNSMHGLIENPGPAGFVLLGNNVHDVPYSEDSTSYFHGNFSQDLPLNYFIPHSYENFSQYSAFNFSMPSSMMDENILQDNNLDTHPEILDYSGFIQHEQDPINNQGVVDTHQGVTSSSSSTQASSSSISSSSSADNVSNHGRENLANNSKNLSLSWLDSKFPTSSKPVDKAQDISRKRGKGNS